MDSILWVTKLSIGHKILSIILFSKVATVVVLVGSGNVGKSFIKAFSSFKGVPLVVLRRLSIVAFFIF
jgi:hypothetical protein